MGRNAKRKQDRKRNHITLAGEQAEVFDAQMDSDRDWFSGSDQCVRFRPEIDGEFNDQLMLGHQPNYIQTFDLETGENIDLPLGWVCVIEVGRAVNWGGPDGFRTRLRCPAPLNGQVRQAMVDYAIRYAHVAYQTLLAQKEGSR
jgi:hypothetical protein